MALETATYISDLVATNPTGGDGKAQGDDHIRLVKSTVKATFPNVAGAVTATHTEMNYLVGVTSLLVGKASPKFTGVISTTSGGGAPSYAFCTNGLILDQLTADDEIASFRSTDVAHGMTTIANDNTFGAIKKYGATTGGINFTGYTSSTVGMGLRGVVTTEDGTRSTAAVAPIMLSGAFKSGTTSTTMSADKNVVVITDGTNARFIFDSDGDSHQDVGVAWTNYSTHDDPGLLTNLSVLVSKPDDPIRGMFGEILEENKQELIDLKLVKFNEDGHHFVNMSKLLMLTVGAAMQNARKLDAMNLEVKRLQALLPA